MDPWETVVKDLAARVPAPLQSRTVTSFSDIPLSRTWKQICPFDSQAAVALLKQKIDQYSIGNDCHQIFFAFQPSKDSEGELTVYKPNFYARMHCEAVLAALLNYCMDKVGSANAEALKQHVKVTSCLRDHGLHLSI